MFDFAELKATVVGLLSQLVLLEDFCGNAQRYRFWDNSVA